MVTLCIPYANGVDEKLIGKYWGCTCINEISEKVQKSLQRAISIFSELLILC